MKNIAACMDTIKQGVFIVGTRMGETYNFMTAAFVTQISFNPCSLAISVADDHYTAELIKEQGDFALSVLAEGQTLEAKSCGYQSGRKFDKASRIRYRVTEQGVPVVDGAAAWLYCKVKEVVHYVDHTIFIAEIADGEKTEAEPMVYASGDFF